MRLAVIFCLVSTFSGCRNVDSGSRFLYENVAYPSEIHLKVIDIDTNKPVPGINVGANFTIPYYPKQTPLAGQSRNTIVHDLLADSNGRVVFSHNKALSLRVGVERNPDWEWIKPINEQGIETFAGWYFDKRKDPPIDGPYATESEPYILYVRQR